MAVEIFFFVHSVTEVLGMSDTDRSKAWSVFRFISKVFSVVKVRAVCRTGSFFNSIHLDEI